MSIIPTLKLKEISNMHIILFKDKNWIYYTLNTNLAITYELKIMPFYGKEIDSKTGQITFAS